jgi:hypothetical protein
MRLDMTEDTKNFTLPDPLPENLSRREASVYLKTKYGISRTPKTLAKLASTGGGPRFKLDGRLSKYQPPVLDEYAHEQLTDLMSSTADYEAA